MANGIQSGIAGQVRSQALWQNQVGKSSALEKLGNLKDLQGVSLKTSKSPEALMNSKEMFKDFFRTEVKAMTEGMDSNHVSQFTKLSEERLSQILDATFGKMEDRLLAGKSISKPKSHMKQANKLAQQFLKELDKPATQVKIQDLRSRVKDMAEQRQTLVKPQFFTDDKGNITVLKAAPQIENLVLKGGGAKGLGYSPALAEMNRAGMLDGLKQVVGTSAGALTAVSIAAGQTPEEFKALTDKNPLSLMFSTSKLQKVYPEIGKASGNISPAQAFKMVGTLDRVLGDKAEAFLSSTKPDDLSAMAEKYANDSGISKNDVLNRLAVLNNPNYDTDRSGKMVTFSDMKMLHAMAPDKFREIQLTGYDRTSKEGLLFNADKSPDLPVAFAARISMAHPAIATAVKLDSQYGLGDHSLADGGIYSNTPVEALYENNDRGMASVATDGASELQSLHEKTMVMIFDDKGKAYSTLHGPPESRETSASGIQKHFAANPNMSTDKLYDKAKEYHSGPGAFVVFHGKIGTMSLSPSDKDRSFAEAQSTLKTLEQIEQRIDAPSSVTYGTVDAVFKSLSDQEKQLILMDGEPRKEDFSGPRADEDFMIANVLYTRIEQQFGL